MPTDEPPRRRKRARRAIALHTVKLCVGVGIVALLLRKHDFRAVGAAILDADPGNLALAWIFTLAGFAALAWMHRVALRPLHMPFTTGAILKILFQIRFYALFLPGGAGVVVKWRKFSKPGNQPGQALALMVFSRVVHSFALLALAFGAIAMDRQFPWPGSVWGIAAVLAATALATWLLISQDAASRLLGASRWSAPAMLPIPDALRTKGKKLLTFAAAFRTLHAWEVTLVLGAAFASGAAHAMQHFFLARAVGLDLSIWDRHLAPGNCGALLGAAHLTLGPWVARSEFRGYSGPLWRRPARGHRLFAPVLCRLRRGPRHHRRNCRVLGLVSARA